MESTLEQRAENHQTIKLAYFTRSVRKGYGVNGSILREDNSYDIVGISLAIVACDVCKVEKVKKATRNNASYHCYV